MTNYMKNNQQGFSVIEGLVVISILGLLLVVVLSVVAPFFVHTFIETSKGNHTGYITAVEKNGMIWKKGRAYIKTDTSSSQEESYCVIDETLLEQLKVKSQNKEKVTLEFKDYFIRGFTKCGSEDVGVITGIK